MRDGRGKAASLGATCAVHGLPSPLRIASARAAGLRHSFVKFCLSPTRPPVSDIQSESGLGASDQERVTHLTYSIPNDVIPVPVRYRYCTGCLFTVTGTVDKVVRRAPRTRTPS